MIQKNQGWTPLIFLVMVIGSLMILSMYRSDRERTNTPITAFYSTDSSETLVTDAASTFTLSSSMFINGADMPKQYTCTDDEGNEHTR
jgi:hypothetical protein